LLAADQLILFMIANGKSDLYSQSVMASFGKKLGMDDGISKNTILNALIRLCDKNILTRMEYGIYQFEDEAFAEWVKAVEIV